MRTSPQKRNEQAGSANPLCISIQSKRHNRRIPGHHGRKITPAIPRRTPGPKTHLRHPAVQPERLPVLQSPQLQPPHHRHRKPPRRRPATRRTRRNPTARPAKQPSLARPAETEESTGSRLTESLRKNSLNSGVYRTSSIAIIVAQHAGIAQLVEQLTCNQ